MDNKTHASNFCIRPFTSVFIGIDGSFKFCCADILDPSERIPSELKIYNTDLSELFNRQNHQYIRNQFLNGKVPKSCFKCFQGSVDILSGARIPYNTHQYKKFNYESIMSANSINFIEMWFENKCNLKCRMCSPYCSDQLEPEWADIINSNDWMRNNYTDYIPYNYSWTNDENSWININKFIEEVFKNNLDHELTLIMAGGEPTICDGMYKLLNYCIENNLSNNIILHYKTNLTVLPHKLLKLWNNFKKIILSVSIDGYQDTFEYIRYPAKWDKLQRNLLASKNISNVEIRIKPTLQIYNILNITELYRWCIENSLSFPPLTDPLLNPHILNIKVLPVGLKNIAATNLLKFYNTYSKYNFVKTREKEFNWLIRYMFSADWSHLFVDFINFTKILDKNRNQSVLTIMPELKSYLT